MFNYLGHKEVAVLPLRKEEVVLEMAPYDFGDEKIGLLVITNQARLFDIKYKDTKYSVHLLTDIP
jgi:hypothetical protein